MNNLRAEVIARAWKDPAFKERLLKDPKNVLKESGYQFPDNVKVKIAQDQRDEFTFVLPERPFESEIPEHELEKIAGGGCPCASNCEGWSAALSN